MVKRSLWVVDSHTAGEPTRVVLDGLPAFSGDSMAGALEWMRGEHDWVRTSLIHEPRGCATIVGAAVFPAGDPGCAAGAVFFDHGGYLGMCGHGMIGVVATLWHTGRIGPGEHRLETPVGPVGVRLHGDGQVTVENVPSYRLRTAVALELGEGRRITGDVAWGGNWFFLSSDHGQSIGWAERERLADFARHVRETLAASGVTGADGAAITHVVLETPAEDAEADADNFVLCPSGTFDRSPCGTAASARVACLAADGRLQPGARWRQRGITGGVFETTYRWDGERVVPSLTGRAFVNADTRVLFDPEDPFRFGIGK